MPDARYSSCCQTWTSRATVRLERFAADVGIGPLSLNIRRRHGMTFCLAPWREYLVARTRWR